jgi:hypothetical protein
MTNITTGNATPHDVGQWVLRAKRGTLDLTVHRNTLSGPGVGTATITLTGPTSFTGPTDPNGHLVVPDLPQGDYELTIREIEGGNDQSFPVIVTVNIPFGDTEAARTRVVNAPLPQIGGELTGPIHAVNLEGDPVPVPAVTVTREYTPPQVQVGSDLVDNTATEDSLVREPGTAPQPTTTVAASADGTPTRYLFEHLPTGVHVLSFSDAVGYSTPGDVTESVESIVDATEVDPVEYTAANRTVIVRVTTGGTPVNDATVTLTQTDPDDLDEDVLTTGVGGAYTFNAVPPELTAYTVTVEKPLHTTQTTTVVVPPGNPATAIEVPTIELPADRAFIRGIAQKRQSASSTVPMANEGRVSLIDVSSGQVVASVVPGSDGGYQFERTTAGTYQVRVELNGFATRESAQFSAPLGVTTNAPNVVVPALATVNVTVEGPDEDAPMAVVITAPPGQTGVAPSRSGNVFTFRLDPGTNPGNGHAYQFQASSPGFVTATVPGGPFTLAPGEVRNPSVTLDERSLEGTVTPAANNTRVELRNAQGQMVAFTATNGSGRYTFSGVDAGTWTVVSERFGTGRGTNSTTISATTGDVSGINITLAARNVNVAFTVTPTNATVEILSGGTVVDSTPPLVATERQLPLTWRASATGFVTETGNVPAPSQVGSFDATSFSVTIPPITLDPVPPPTTEAEPPPTTDN